MPKPLTELPDSQVSPAPELEKRTRRHFSTEYKLQIIAEADACRHGELGALLRREGLYSGQLQQWRRALAQGGAEALGKTRPGPKSAKTPEQRRIEQLEKDNARLQRKLQVTQDCVDLQKKALSMLDLSGNGDNA
jgi:transposase